MATNDTTGSKQTWIFEAANMKWPHSASGIKILNSEQGKNILFANF